MRKSKAKRKKINQRRSVTKPVAERCAVARSNANPKGPCLAQSVASGVVKRRPLEDELLESLEDMVNQHCTVNTDVGPTYLDSMALSANASAMRILAKHNRIVIKNEYGRRVIANWKERE